MDDLPIQEIIDSIHALGIQKWKNTDPEVLNEAIKTINTLHPYTYEEENEEAKNDIDSILDSYHETMNHYNTHKSYYIDLRTVPISNDINLSREFLSRSSDYIQEIAPLINDLKNNKINLFDFYRLRAKMFRKLYFRLYYRLNTKAVKERTKNSLKYKGISRHIIESYYETIPATSFQSPILISTKAGIIHYPTPKQLIDKLQLVLLAIDTKHYKKKPIDYSVMAALQVAGANDSHVIASSVKVRILDFDGSPMPEDSIHDAFQKSIDKLIDTVDGYSYVDEIQVMSTYLSVTAFATYDVSNWFPSLSPSDLLSHSDYWRLKDASIYLAIDKSKSTTKKSCQQMCVEYLGGTWNPLLPIHQMLPQKNVIFYFPKTGNIRDVSSFNDLAVSSQTFEEITPNNDCKSVARLLKFAGHMGVISSIASNKKSKKAQSFRPVNSNKKSSNYIEVFFDIEAYQDSPDPSVSVYYQKPYLLCWSDACYQTVHSIVGENCCADFVDTLLSTYPNQTVVLYAWYGSGYDYHHILTHLIKKCSSAAYTLKNTSIMSTTIIFESPKIKIITKDPFLFMLTSLHKAAKAFNVTDKSDFPHNAIHSQDDLQKTLDNWYHTKSSIIQKFPENSNLNLEVSRHITNIYEPSKNYKTILEHAIEYCKIDVIAMKEIWLKFQSLLQDTFGIPVSLETFTLSQLSMKLLESNLPKHVRLHVPSTDEYLFFKNAIYGGRVVAENGNYNEEILYADVVSLYPSAMKLLEHSYGVPYKTTSIDWSKHGIYNVTLTYPLDSPPPNFMQFVPKRNSSGKLSWSWFKSHTATYHTYDLLIAKDLGYSIDCIEGYEFPKKDYILDSFVTKLFDLKNTHSSCSCPEQPCPIRMIAKIALNGGGYGKFVQRPVIKTTHIVPINIVASLYDEIPKNSEGKIKVGSSYINPPEFYNLDGKEFDKMIIEQDDDPRYSTACGISILSGSRYRLYLLCKQFPNMRVVYSDTDSIFVLKSSVDQSAFENACGSNLGALDNTIEGSTNNTISKMIILGPKMYAYKYITDSGYKTTFHAKGVPTSMLTWNLYEHLISSKEHYASFYFDVISKRITTVATRNITKRITQT